MTVPEKLTDEERAQLGWEMSDDDTRESGGGRKVRIVELERELATAREAADKQLGIYRKCIRDLEAVEARVEGLERELAEAREHSSFLERDRDSLKEACASRALPDTIPNGGSQRAFIEVIDLLSTAQKAAT